jgi:hypothetical protein
MNTINIVTAIFIHGDNRRQQLILENLINTLKNILPTKRNLRTFILSLNSLNLNKPFSSTAIRSDISSTTNPNHIQLLTGLLLQLLQSISALHIEPTHEKLLNTITKKNNVDDIPELDKNAKLKFTSILNDTYKFCTDAAWLFVTTLMERLQPSPNSSMNFKTMKLILS